MKCANMTCPHRAKAKQLCGPHYARAMAGLSIALPIESLHCRITGCTREVYIQRDQICMRHYDQTRLGRPLTLEPDIEVIEMDLYAGIDADRIAADQGIALNRLTQCLRTHGRGDLVKELLKGRELSGAA